MCTNTHTLSSMYTAQNRAMARSYGSDGRIDALPSAQTSSMYSTMIMDSLIGLPLWISTGIFLYTGLDLRSSSLLVPISSSKNSYPTPLRFSAILGRMTNGLGHAPRTFTSSTDPVAISAMQAAIWQISASCFCVMREFGAVLIREKGRFSLWPKFWKTEWMKSRHVVGRWCWHVSLQVGGLYGLWRLAGGNGGSQLYGKKWMRAWMYSHMHTCMRLHVYCLYMHACAHACIAFMHACACACMLRNCVFFKN